MQEILIALFAVGVGAIFSFYGYKAMRLLFPLWGLVAGYWVGAALVSAITGDTLFSTALSIGVGIAFALIFAVLAYLFYAVAIIIFMGALGYWLGAGLLIAIGIDPGVLTFLVGSALAIVFAAMGFIGNMPKYALLFLTAFFGGAMLVSGLLLMGNVINPIALEHGVVAVVTDQSWIWQALWLTLGAAGFLTQLSHSAQEELNWEKEWEVR